MNRLTAPFLLLGVLSSVHAHAAEVRFEGFYQARMRVFDNLSLNRDLENSEHLAWYMQHRVNLRPQLWVTDQVAVFTEIRALDNTPWGSENQSFYDYLSADTANGFGTGGQNVPSILTDSLVPPYYATGGSAGDGVVSPVDGNISNGQSPKVDIYLARVWAEIHTRIGTFKFGRQPLHWGLGIWQNDGLRINQEFGDSADRLSWEHIIQNVWVRAAFDINTAGYINRNDDVTSYSLAGAYRTERIEAGLQLLYRHRGAMSGAKFDLFTADAAFNLEFGMFGIKGEVVGQFGGGSITKDVTDTRLMAVGSVLDLSVSIPKVDVHVQGGLASGDGDPSDNKLHTFAFDRDFNVGLLMFEQPAPIMTAGNASANARDFSMVASGNSVSNALYLKPSVAVEPLRGFFVDASFLAARTMKVPAAEVSPDRRAYGYEFDLGVRYAGIEHFTLAATGAAFLPGNRFKNFTNNGLYSSGFKQAAFGGQLLARVDF